MKLNKLTSQKYKLTCDESVTLTIKPLTAAQHLDILGNVQDAKHYGSALLNACQAGITDWIGVTDGKKALPCTQENIALLPQDALIEAGTHILQLSQLEPEEKKV